MTQRTQVRFNFYNKTDSLTSPNSFIPFDVVDFDVGGLNDISTYR